MKTFVKNFGIFVIITSIGLFLAACDEPQSALSGIVSIDGISNIDGKSAVYAGQTLTANTDKLGGKGSISYQWMLNGNKIGTENKKTYTARITDVASALTVSVTRAGYNGKAVSEPVYTYYPLLTGTITIEGLAQTEQTLTVNTENLNGTGTISYQWMLDEKDAAGEIRNSYYVKIGDAGKTLKVRVSRSGYTGAVYSDPTDPVSIRQQLTGTVSIEGYAGTEQLLTANTEALNGSGEISYQWRRGSIDISGAVNKTYTVQTADVGEVITVKVTRAGNYGEAVSAATAVIIRAVNDITGVPLSTAANAPLTLSGTVVPAEAANKTIVWSLDDAGTTGAVINGNTMTTTEKGTAIVRATITNGIAVGTNYTKEFSITVGDIVAFDQWVTRIDFGSGSEVTINLNNLYNHDIYLVKVNTSAGTVANTNTGRVKNIAPELTIKPSPQIFKAPENKLPRMGRPRSEVNTSHSRDTSPEYLKSPETAIDRPLFNTAVVGDKRNFLIEEPPLDSGVFISKESTLLATGTHSNVWVMDSLITQTTAQELADKFDIIYPAMTNVFGYEYGGAPGHQDPGGRDGDLKIQILVYNIGFNIAGYYWSKDHDDSTDSNKAEMFYLDSTVVNQMPLYSYDTLTHEFQHMIHYNQKTIENKLNTNIWYNEMMSMMAQDIIADIIEFPVDHPEYIINVRVPTFIADYITEGFTEWLGGGTWTSYATKYAFGAYLTRNYGGAEFIKELSANNSMNNSSITDALSKREPGLTFDEALIRFSEAMIYSDTSKTPPGVNTFNKTVSDKIGEFTYTARGFDIWNTDRDINFPPSGKGPVVYDLAQRSMRRQSIMIHQSDAWKNKYGSYSITFVKPISNGITFVLLVKEN